jgi:hypothetical protein
MPPKYTEDIIHTKERCRQQFDVFLSYLFNDDSFLHSDIRFEAYMAGGAIASLLIGEEPRDWDIFLPQNIYVKKLEKYFEQYTTHVKCITKNAITLKNNIQVITRWTGPREELINQFDFLHCKGSYSRYHDTLYLSEKIYDACKYRRLVPIVSAEKLNPWRVRKFLLRGWELDKGELEGLRLLNDLDDEDLEQMLNEPLDDKAYTRYVLKWGKV